MDKLTEYFDAARGRRLKLAEKLGVKPSAISQWKKAPIARIAEIEAATGIPREKLRPDIFKKRSKAEAAE